MKASINLAPVVCGLVALPIAIGCAGDEQPGAQEGDLTSKEATLLELEWDGQVVTGSTFNVRKTIEDQMLYTIGHLNGDNSVGRLDALELTNIETERLEDDTTLVRYHAKMPVGWGSKTNLPETYDFVLPRRADHTGQEEFTEKLLALVRGPRRPRRR